MKAIVWVIGWAIVLTIRESYTVEHLTSEANFFIALVTILLIFADILGFILNLNVKEK